MARTGTAENKQAQKDTAGQQTTAFKAGQAGVSQYNKNIATLDAGGSVAANPWQNSGYLANVNKQQSSALNEGENAGRMQLEDTNRRTGGLNSTATLGAQKDLSLQKIRLADQLTAERTAGDYGKNVQYQQQMAEAPLAATSAESPYYGTATGGRDAALGNLTQFGMASYGPWQSAIGAIGAGAGAFLGAKKP